MSKHEVFGVKIDCIDQFFNETIIRHLFKEFDVYSVYIGPNKSFAYVNFLSASDAENAVSSFNNKQVNGRKLQLSLQPRIDFRKLTDCKFNGACTKKNCVFRHYDGQKEKCERWLSKDCKNADCRFSHPSFSLSEDTSEPSSPINQPDVVDVSSSNNTVENYLQCSICFEIYDDPKQLACGHLFCKDCLNSWIKFQNKRVCFKCPECNKEYVLEEQKTISSDPSIQNVPFALKNIIESTSERNGKRITDSNCFKENCKNTSEQACLKCGILSCDKCLIDHSNICKNKNLLKIRYSYKEGYNVGICGDHDCQIDSYCINCDRCVCKYCSEWSKCNEHRKLNWNEYIDMFDNRIADFHESSKKVLATSQDVNKGAEIKTKVHDYIANTKLEILSKLWFALNVVEKETIQVFDHLFNEHKQKNATAVTNAKEIETMTERMMKADPLSKVLEFAKNLELIKKQNIPGELDVIFPSPSLESLESQIFKLINDSIGSIDIISSDGEDSIIKVQAESVSENQNFRKLDKLDSRKKMLDKLMRENSTQWKDNIPADERPPLKYEEEDDPFDLGFLQNKRTNGEEPYLRTASSSSYQELIDLTSGEDGELDSNGDNEYDEEEKENDETSTIVHCPVNPDQESGEKIDIQSSIAANDKMRRGRTKQKVRRRRGQGHSRGGGTDNRREENGKGLFERGRGRGRGVGYRGGRGGGRGGASERGARGGHFDFGIHRGYTSGTSEGGYRGSGNQRNNRGRGTQRDNRVRGNYRNLSHAVSTPAFFNQNLFH